MSTCYYQTDRFVSYRILDISKHIQQDLQGSVTEWPIMTIIPETVVAKFKYSYFLLSACVLNSTLQDVSLNSKLQAITLTFFLHRELWRYPLQGPQFALKITLYNDAYSPASLWSRREQL
jgi:hypothetical protein